MKKKFVVALVAAMSLNVAGTGTVFAMDKVSTTASEKEHVHGDNCEWVVDKEAWIEEVFHPAEGHYVTIEKEPAWDEEVTRIGTFCHNCGFEIHSNDEWIAHSEASNGQCMSYGDKEVTEIIHHEAIMQEVFVVDKKAWIEKIEHPEEGHWVCDGEPQEPEQPESPEQPGNPDVEIPETPEQKPEENQGNVPTQETETQKEGTAPKTGDSASALPVVGAGVTSLGVVLATILKKRK